MNRGAMNHGSDHGFVNRGLYIGNRWKKGGGPSLVSIDPASGEIRYSAPAADPADVDEAVQNAFEAQPSWEGESFEKRAGHVKAFKACLEKHKEEFAGLISREMGKPLWESKTEVAAMLGKADISIEAHQTRLQETEQSVPSGKSGAKSRVGYRAHGVVAVLGPFNLPGHLPNGHIIPALLAGNAVVYKPSDKTPAVGELYVRIWEEAGLPGGVLQLVQGRGEIGEALLQHPQVRGIFFTGSAAVGQAINRWCAGYAPDKILALEMGGNNPLVIYQPGDALAAAHLTVQSAFITSGQRCVCARRLIVVEDKLTGDFLEALLRISSGLRCGAASEMPEPFLGPLVDAAAVDKVLAKREEWLAAGGVELLGPKRNENLPNLVTPIILESKEGSQTNHRPFPDEEVFGPLLQVYRVDSLEAAIHLANRTQYGLAAGIVTQDAGAYQTFYRGVRAGIVNWNRQITGASSRAPFGGVGYSGNHRPSAYFAADYCAYPVASLETDVIEVDEESLPPGVPR